MQKRNLEVLETMQKKYGDLVWFARKKPEHMKIEKVKENCIRIMEEYPKEFELLQGDTGDWQHGFHSGCYAMLNMILTHEDLADGLNDFPLLDT